MITADNRPDEEPKDGQHSEGSAPTEKSAYAEIRDTLGEEDLNNHEVCKVIARRLKGENKELNAEVKRLKGVEEDYYEKREEASNLLIQLDGLKESVGVRELFIGIAGVFLTLVFTSGTTITDKVPSIFACALCAYFALKGSKLGWNLSWFSRLFGNNKDKE